MAIENTQKRALPEMVTCALKRLFCRFAALIVLLFSLPGSGGLRDPFPPGYAMGNLGTIIWDDGSGGHQPWVPASFLGDSSGFGVSATGISYYDRMDNLSARSIYQAGGGIWVAWRGLLAKASYLHLNALDTFFEQEGFLSLGTHWLRYVSISSELTVNRIGLTGSSDRRHIVADIGFSAWVPWRYAAVSFACDNIPVKNHSDKGIGRRLPVITAGIHTVRNRLGAQGVLLRVAPENAQPVRFSLGEEFWFAHNFAVHAALSSNPTIFSVGIVANWPSFGLSAALANHPALGWSKGIGVETVHSR